MPNSTNDIEKLRGGGPGVRDPFAAWIAAVKALEDLDRGDHLGQQAIWWDHFLGRFADRAFGHAAFLLWDAVREAPSSMRGHVPSASHWFSSGDLKNSEKIVREALGRL